MTETEAAELAALESDLRVLSPGSPAPEGAWGVDTDGARRDQMDGRNLCYHDEWTNLPPRPRYINALEAAKAARAAAAQYERGALERLEADVIPLGEGRQMLRWCIMGTGERCMVIGSHSVSYDERAVRHIWPASATTTFHPSPLLAARAARELAAKLIAEHNAANPPKPAHPERLAVGQVWRCDKTGNELMVTNNMHRHWNKTGEHYIGSGRLMLEPGGDRILSVSGLTYLGSFAFTPADKE